jgi:hypothetical protein
VSVQFPSQSTIDYTRVDYHYLNPDRNPPLERKYTHIYFGDELYERVTNGDTHQSNATALVLRTMQNMPSVSHTSSIINLIESPDHTTDYDPGSTEWEGEEIQSYPQEPPTNQSATSTSNEPKTRGTKRKRTIVVENFTNSEDTTSSGRTCQRPATDTSGFVCHQCETSTTTHWRKGPAGKNTLCNKCGLVYARVLKKDTNNKGTLDFILNTPKNN